MAKQSIFDVIVIGSGSAGFSAVEAARAVGARVCLIEKGKLGGECPNEACVPSKALLHAATMYRRAQIGRDRGIEIDELSFNFSGVMAYKDRVVARITGGGERGERYEQMLKQLKVVVKFGEAKFVDAHRVEVGAEIFEGRAVVIATGATDVVPPIDGCDRARAWQWRDAMVATRLPKSMAIIGGGPVGCELATFFSTFGTRVVLIESSAAVLDREDAQVSAYALAALARLGVEVVLEGIVEEIVSAHGTHGVRVRGHDSLYAVEQIVLAAGKRPNIGTLNLRATGVRLDGRGRFTTAADQRTNVRHIFAAGDVDGGMMFTHTAHHEGAIAGYNAAIIALGKRAKSVKRDERVVPRVTFLDPEVASVGMTQQEVKEKFGSALVGRFELAGLGRSATVGVQVGFVKLVAHPKTRKLLGAHMIGERAGEVIHEAALAIYLNAPVDKIASMIHAYPTFSEALRAAAVDAHLE